MDPGDTPNYRFFQSQSNARVVCIGVISATILFTLCRSYIEARGSDAFDILQYRETFADTFRQPLDVTPWGPSRWIAHTPWNGDFGDARFADPHDNFPFTTGSDGLAIIARKGVDGKWESGLLSTLDKKRGGFAQTGGYFEARMKLPAGPGVWPAFWLVGSGDADYSVEIDIVEYYGQFTDAYHVNYHLWPKSKRLSHIVHGITVPVERNSLFETFHTYGAELLGSNIVYYLDRHEVARMEAPLAAKSPLSMLINLALGSGWPIDKTNNPSVLQVDYVKAFARR
jgi:beta-glucanase (GH16 family)